MKLSSSFLLSIILLLIYFFCYSPIPIQTANADASSLVSLINQYRESYGLSSLVEDQSLTNAACWLAQDMSNNGYFDHVDSLGRDMSRRLADFGVSGGYRAENIYSLTGQDNSAQKVFDGWKASSGHNATMLGPNYTRIGIGNTYQSAAKTYYWVADFASGNATAASGCSPIASPPTSINQTQQKSSTTFKTTKVTYPQKPAETSASSVNSPTQSNQISTPSNNPSKNTISQLAKNYLTLGWLVIILFALNPTLTVPILTPLLSLAKVAQV